MRIYVIEERYQNDRDIAGATTDVKDAVTIGAAVVNDDTIAIIEVWDEQPRRFVGKYKLWTNGGLTGGKLSRTGTGDEALENYLKSMGWWTI